MTTPDDGRHRLAPEGREGLALEDDDDVLARPRVVGGLEALHGAEARRLPAQADGEEFTNLRASCARRAPRTSSGYRRQDCRRVVAAPRAGPWYMSNEVMWDGVSLVSM